jgi:two-component system chemotaxis response regulator CheY
MEGSKMLRRVLIVDDSETVRKILGDTLKGAGYEVTEAENGEQALAYARRDNFDLLMTDLKMPVMNGYEMVKALRQIDGYRFTPTIMLSSEHDATKKRECLAVGVSSWLSKPFQPAHVLQIIKLVTP